jgi:prepilin-type N-terminal cleavage/methylation domain-containing protein
MKQTQNSLKMRAGFTLVEILITTVVVGFLMLGIGQLMLDVTKTSFITGEKLEINADIRQFTLEMAENARSSNGFLMYRSFNAADRDSTADQLSDGMTGDFLLLLFMEPYPNADDPEHYTRVVGYFRYPDAQSKEGPVYRFEKRFYRPDLSSIPPGFSGPWLNSEDTTPEKIIADLNPSGAYPTVIQLSRGLANGQLFYNYLDRSVMIKGEIVHGNEAKRITDTYNYTVSPRG